MFVRDRGAGDELLQAARQQTQDRACRARVR
jgi:hypothetical protein